MTSPRSLLTAAEVAEEFQVEPDTIRRWAREGLLPSITLPGGRGLKRFRRSDVEAIMRGEQPPAAKAS